MKKLDENVMVILVLFTSITIFAFIVTLSNMKSPFNLYNVFTCSVTYIEDITRWREDMNFMFEWQEQYLTSERSERVRYCSCYENIKFISSTQGVMFFLLYGETNSTKAKGGNRDVIERYDTRKGDIRKIRHSGPG